MTVQEHLVAPPTHKRRDRRQAKPAQGHRPEGAKLLMINAKRLQGLPPEFDLPSFTVEAKIRALGNAVPLVLGRAVAKAVKRAIGQREVAA